MSIMQCDAVLLNGNVIVNESMLTGTSNTPLGISFDDFRTFIGLYYLFTSMFTFII